MAAIAETRSEFGQSYGIVRPDRSHGKETMSTGVSVQASEARSVQSRRIAQGAVFSVIMALSFSHFLNDMMQSLVPAL